VAPSPPTLKRSRKDRAAAAPSKPKLVILEPAENAGRSFDLDGEVSIGRAAGCQITLDDTYASQIHARVFARDNQWQVEDVGSTNGTWLNRHKVSGPMVVQRGDRIQIGNTVLEMQ
jgi:pSer/pThr/pTyr-binding forkhead associated (FHA) protein